MNLRILFLFPFLLMVNIVSAQCPTGFSIVSQSDLDYFSDNYPDCTEMQGQLSIQCGGITPITDLSALQNITSISGGLNILFCHGLTDLSGLDNLTSIGGPLFIEFNNNLTSLSGLDNLTAVGSSLNIDSNNNLIDLSGLNNLISIGNSLLISSNFGLTSLSGLDNLTSVGFNLDIASNFNLTSLFPTNSLNFVGFELDIYNNSSLNNLSGLENLTVVANLAISLNNSLTNLSGLENMDTITNLLFVTDNEVLTELTELQNVLEIGEFVRIINNPMLDYCSIISVCNHIMNGESSSISENATGCNTEDEIISNCELVDVNELADLKAAIFPNPTSGDLTVSFVEAIEGALILRDYTGKTILTQQLKMDNQIDMREVPNGIYMIEIKTERGTLTERVAKIE